LGLRARAADCEGLAALSLEGLPRGRMAERNAGT
jgi:hypothetical protein